MQDIFTLLFDPYHREEEEGVLLPGDIKSRSTRSMALYKTIPLWHPHDSGQSRASRR